MFSLLEERTATDDWLSAIWSASGSSWQSGFGATTLPRIAPEQVLAIPAAKACISLISDQIAVAPQFVEAEGADGEVVIEPIPRWMEQPNPENTCCDVTTQLMTSLLTAGNAFGYITRRDGFGRPSSMQVLYPLDVGVERDDAGFLRYRVHGEVVRTADVVHVRSLMFGGADVGVGPISFGARTMAVANAQDHYAGARFDSSDNGAAIPAYFLGSDQAISENQAKEVVRGIRRIAAGKATAPAVLPYGMKPMRVELTAEELELLVSRKYSDGQICTIYGVPPFLVGVPSDNDQTYSNVRDHMLHLVAFVLRSHARRLSAALSPKLLPPGKTLVYDLHDLAKDLMQTAMSMTVDAQAMTATMQQGES